jgi:anti-sigma B factor antagonist
MRIAEPLRPHADVFVIPDGRATVALSGELDIAAVPLMGRAFAEALDQTETGVIADLSRVSFIDASGLGALVTAANRSRHLAGGMNVSGIPAHMNKLLRIAGLGDQSLWALPPATSTSTFPSPRDPLPMERRPIRGAVVWAAGKPDVTASLIGRISR